MTEDIQQRVDYFLKQLIGPVLLAAAFEIFVQYQEHTAALVWFANGAVFTYIFARFYKDAQAHELQWVTGLTGLTITFIVAVVKIFLFKEIWYLFNAFTEPLVVGAIMGVAALATATLLKKSTHLMLSIKKGGES